MSLEFHPVGLRCNLSCTYCYEHEDRNSQNSPFNPEVLEEACVKARKQKYQEITLHGGEPLLLSIKKLEQALAIIYKHFGKTWIQTNATLITGAHLELFHKYDTHVGVSLDGPGECSYPRWGEGGLQFRIVEKAEKNLELLLKEKHHVSLIATLHNENCRELHWHKLVAWFQKLDLLGLESARLHFMQGGPAHLKVGDDLLYKRLIELSEIETGFKHLRFDIFREIIDLLVSRQRQFTCVWNGCNPSRATAGKAIGPDGTVYNCGRVGCVKPDGIGSQRLTVLRNLEHSYGGCKSCQYFALCKGGCPGTGLDGDPMKRTSDCLVIYRLFSHFEQMALRMGMMTVPHRLQRVNRSECEQKRRYPVEIIDPSLWTDNGFKTQEAMDRAHGPIVDAAIHCAYRIGNIATRPVVCDFGCGNGELLGKINSTFKIIPAGVDDRPRSIEKAKKRFPEGIFQKAKVHDPIEMNYDVALISVQRLREVEGSDHRTLMNNLARADFVVFYDYDGIENPGQYLRNYFGNLVWSPTEFRSSGCERPYVTITIVEPRHEQNASV